MLVEEWGDLRVLQMVAQWEPEAAEWVDWKAPYLADSRACQKAIWLGGLMALNSAGLKEWKWAARREPRKDCPREQHWVQQKEPERVSQKAAR